MAIVILNRGDFRIIKPTAQSLYLHWGDKKECNFWATMMGICAEYAVIAYLNEILKATPEIKFRTEYKNGTDGGFDFKCPDDLTWDVKCAGAKEEFNLDRVTKSKAQIICLTKRVDSRTYEILGFAPKDRIINENLKLDKLIPIEMVLKLFPKRFDCNEVLQHDRKYTTQLQRIGGLVKNTLIDLETKIALQKRA